MNRQNLYLKVMVLGPLLLMPIGFSQELSGFMPTQEPILNTPQPKANIQMVLDDSTSMRTNTDVYLAEHTYGQGQPVCNVNAAARRWGADQEKEGMYNPFSSRNVYAPWDPEDERIDEDGLLNGQAEPPAYPRCLRVKRSTALNYVVQEVLNRYRDKAYVGANVINEHGNVLSDGRVGGLITLPLQDYGNDEQEDFDKKLVPLLDAIEKSRGVTPTGEGLYHALKILRGGAVALNAGTTTDGRSPNRFYPYYRYETPLRYRCQQSHIVNMSDGASGSTTVNGIFREDLSFLTGLKISAKETDFIVGGVNLIYRAVIGSNFRDIGRLAAALDLRNSSKPTWNAATEQWEEKRVDDAGKSWNDPRYSTKMSVVLNSISLSLNPQATSLQNLVTPSGGVSLGFDSGTSDNPAEYTAEDLLGAFDSVFSDIIQSSSSTLAVNDRVYADVLPHKVEMRNGRLYLDGKLTDISSLSSIRYSTRYGFGQRFGIVSAGIPYIKNEATNEIDIYELWNTSSSIRRGQGNYVTFLDDQQGYRNYPIGTRLYRVHTGRVFSAFRNIYREMTGLTNAGYHIHVHWLYQFTRTSFRPYDLRPRMTPMGSITNSDVRLANKDILNINIAKDRMSKELKSEMVSWLKFKAKWQPKNYIVVGDNDGFINFINAQRGLNHANRYKGGQRDTAYFPQISYRRMQEIAGKGEEATLVFEGHTNLMDAKVYQKGRGNYYATLGITGMAGGGKGLVGYRIFASEVNAVNNWVDNERKPALPASYSNPIDKVTPLFEISNEGDPKHRTKGFENLGYTYSGFEYFNRTIIKNGEGQGQAVAVFGNGFGTDKSTIYFIDAYTGEKLNEIILNHNGGGAATPAILVAPDASGQRIERLYVGDYSGTMYRVEFSGSDFTNSSNIKITSLFQAPITNIGQSAISTRPLLIKNAQGQMQVFFGTGIAADKTRDRGDNSEVLHGIYGITDRNISAQSSFATAEYINSHSGMSLSPQLSVEHLNRGDVKYKEGIQIDYQQKNRYDIDIVVPENPTPNNAANTRLDGWYVRLSADGMKSGERVIQDPKYDGINRSIIFSTWGVIETGDTNEFDLYDPCLRDISFGKMLAFNVSTGAAAIGGGNGGLSNVGSVGTAPGGITGDLIGAAPEDNSTTSLKDLGEDLVDELINIVGKGDSSLFTGSNGSNGGSGDTAIGVTCEGSIDGEERCIATIKRKPAPAKPLLKHRVSTMTVF